AVSCLRSRLEKNSRELYFRRRCADAGRSWNQRVHLHVEALSGARAAEAQLRTRRVRRYGSFSRQRRSCSHHWSGHLCRWRVSDNGHVTISSASSHSSSYSCSHDRTHLARVDETCRCKRIRENAAR